ncbi:hypothetical protein A4X09_0g7703 [Tilletia walkeri]|uniref:DDE Tnp4 domain-containing protein n=1 Tax=Tilletia walkeri TaxID=117179 RepID=A0A8X7N1D8_9BASI|nr:hypothetical protein A4X09_0g7703 [Tilletia walkeri]
MHDSDRRRKLLFVLLLGISALVLAPSRRRVYLTRQSLTPSRRSAAATLLAAKDDKSYISAFGFDVRTFDIILTKFKPFLPPAPTLKRRPRSLTPRLHLSLVLYYLTSPQRQKSIALVFGLTPAAVSRSIWSGLSAMFDMMAADPDTWAIKWPTAAVMTDMAAAVRAREPLLKGVFGFVDGLNLRIYQPSNIDEQNAYYNGWLADTYCSQIASGLYTLLSDPARTPPPFALLADSAFPYGKELTGRILSRPKDNVAAKEKDGAVHLLWEAIIRQRQAAEWGMRALQGAFGRLDLRLPTHKAKRALLLSVVFSLHNFRARNVGLNQIKEVYFPQWQAARRE